MKYVPYWLPVVEKSKMRGHLSPVFIPFEVPGALYFARITKVKSAVPKCTLCKLTYARMLCKLTYVCKLT